MLNTTILPVEEQLEASSYYFDYALCTSNVSDCFARNMLNSFRHFASIGALIMVTALALGPFFQQTVKYVSIPSVHPTEFSSSVAAYKWGDFSGSAREFVNYCECIFTFAIDRVAQRR